jgi:hypothetical protein
VDVSRNCRRIAFLPSDFVYDADEDRTNSGNTAGDEDDPEIGTTIFSYVNQGSMSAYLAQISR